MKRRHFISLATVGLGSLAWVRAADWPQWRGLRRDGVASDVAPPTDWPASLEKSWSVEVGVGHSSPVVVGNRVVVLSRQEENEVVRVVRLATGELAWKKTYPAAYKVNQAAADHGAGPRSTPVVAGERVITFGISGVLSAWDLQSGKRLWQRTFVDEFSKTSPLYGAAASPLVDGDNCIVPVGGHDSGAIIAVSLKNGETVWKWDEDGPAYSSPMIGRFSESRHLVAQSQKHCVGLDPDEGKLLWKLPFETEYDQNSVTPVLYNQSVILSGYNRGISRHRIEEQDGEWRADELWSNKEVSLYMNTPIVSEDRLFGFSQRHKGELFSLDLTTGKTLWTGEGRMGENASLVLTGETIWALTNRGEMIVFAATDGEFQKLAGYSVSDRETWAHPVLLPNGILVKDETHLSCWRWKSGEATAAKTQS